MVIDVTQRASPDALLALAKKEGRGRLKIFLGAAPGVGKTYAMLTAGRSEKSGGRDVVAGLIETHGRRETEQLVDGFGFAAQADCLPQPIMKSSTWTRRGAASGLHNDDTPTPMAGQPPSQALAGHDELLAAGIDVWTTLNIQHLEA